MVRCPRTRNCVRRNALNNLIEQDHRRCEAADRRDVGACKGFSTHRNHDRRYRADALHSQRTVPTGPAGCARSNCARCLERCDRSLTSPHHSGDAFASAAYLHRNQIQERLERIGDRLANGKDEDQGYRELQPKGPSWFSHEPAPRLVEPWEPWRRLQMTAASATAYFTSGVTNTPATLSAQTWLHHCEDERHCLFP